MSRIEQALRRVSGTAGPGPELTETQFKPAWEVDAKRDDIQPEAPRAALSTPPPPERSQRVSFSSAWRERVAAPPDGDPALIEQFRRLAGVLHQAQRSTGLRRVMVTSAVPGDGKTLTAVNLALVLASSYRHQVLLVDADLRCPSIPTVVELGERAGLS